MAALFFRGVAGTGGGGGGGAAGDICAEEVFADNVLVSAFCGEEAGGFGSED